MKLSYDVENSSIIKNHDVKFVECESNKQTKEKFEVFNDKSLNTLFKIESINSTSNSKSESKDVVGIFNNRNRQQYPIVESSFIIKKIQLLAHVLGREQTNTITPLSLPPTLPSPMLSHSQVCKLV